MQVNELFGECFISNSAEGYTAQTDAVAQAGAHPFLPSVNSNATCTSARTESLLLALLSCLTYVTWLQALVPERQRSGVVV